MAIYLNEKSMDHFHDEDDHGGHDHSGEWLANIYSKVLKIFVHMWFPAAIIYVIFRRNEH